MTPHTRSALIFLAMFAVAVAFVTLVAWLQGGVPS